MSNPTARPGGRTARVRRAVLDATLRHVLDHGLEGLTIATIAAAAGVAETTVYRRWGTPAAVLADTITDLAAVESPVPDTGSLHGDLEKLLRQIAQLLAQPGLVRLLGASAALSADSDVAAARDLFWRHRFEMMTVVVERAAARRELRDDVLAHDVIETLAAPLYFRVLVTHDPIDDAFIERCVAATLTLYGAAD